MGDLWPPFMASDKLIAQEELNIVDKMQQWEDDLWKRVSRWEYVRCMGCDGQAAHTFNILPSWYQGTSGTEEVNTKLFTICQTYF